MNLLKNGLTRGFTDVDHFHPGSSLNLPIEAPPTFEICTFPLSNFRVSSGVLMLVFSIVDVFCEDICDWKGQISLVIVIGRFVAKISSVGCRELIPFSSSKLPFSRVYLFSVGQEDV